MAAKLFLISLLSMLAFAQDTCPDFVTELGSKKACTNDYECVSLCCENGKCNSKCTKTERDECPTRVAEAKAAEEKRLAEEKEKEEQERQTRLVLVIWVPIAAVCVLFLICSTVCGIAANKYLDMQKEKQPSNVSKVQTMDETAELPTSKVQKVDDL